MHNLNLADMNIWDPNVKLGDMQLMDIAPCITRDEAMVEEVKKVIAYQGVSLS